MKRSLLLASVCTLLVGLSYAWGAADDKASGADDGKLLSHNVYFALKEATPEAKQKLVDACKKHLSQHPGLMYFAAGTLCEESKSPLHVQDFDVALIMVFKSHEALKTYAGSAAHQKFIAENMATFKGVRVFDADVDRAVVPNDSQAKK
jgi:hypothetical protein